MKPKLKPQSRYNLNLALRKGGFKVITKERTVVINCELEDLSKVNQNRFNRAKKYQYNIVKEIF